MRVRAAVTAMFFVALGALAGPGCTSTSSHDGCYSDNECAVGERCDEYYGTCVVPTDGGGDACSAPTDCPASYTCGEKGRCSPGDCYFSGCITGYECKSSTGRWECLASSGDTAGAAGTSD
ncbi:MAG TPA: hypothetical protein VGC79_35980 [Polyangiaceae bacterium]